MSTFGNPPVALATQAQALERVEINSDRLDDTTTQAIDAMLLAVTGQIEAACGRPLVERTGTELLLDGCDIPASAPIELGEAVPAVSIAELRIDRNASQTHEVDFAAAETLVPSSAYRLVGPSHSGVGWAEWRVYLDSAYHPSEYGEANVQLTLTHGYTLSNTPTQDQHAMPAQLVEACLRQFAVQWRGRHDAHLRSKGQSFQVGGGGTTSMRSGRLDDAVVDMLRPFATPEAAFSLCDRGGVSG